MLQDNESSVTEIHN